MVEMTHSPSTTSLGLAYNAFLFALIEDDSGGTPLSTVSALARLDIDPWREAAELAALPADAATQRLATLLGRLPGRLNGLLDAGATAVRLVALLPKRNSADRGLPMRSGAGVAIDPPLIAIGFVIAVIVLLTGLVAAPGDQKPFQTNLGPAAASSSAPPDAMRAKSPLG